MQQVQYVKIGNIISNPNNPRILKDARFEKLVQSLIDFPEMLEKRPLICVTTASGKFMVLGGNQRLKAATKAGIKQLPVMLADDWSEEKRQEFVIKDNIGFGDWDWEVLKTEWDEGQLIDWGLEMPEGEQPFEHEQYSREIKSPAYKPGDNVPSVDILYNADKYKDLICEIDASSVNEDIKAFLKIAAARHIVFNYENIADFYAHSDKDIQVLMEKSALVIIDFNKAIEYGFVELTKQITEEYINDYGDN